MNDAPQPTRADYASRMAAYCADGAARAEAIANKGPLVLDGEGRLEASIREAYRNRGFYVFEDVVGAGEIEDLRAGVADMLERAPAQPGASLDAKGRPAYGRDLAKAPYIFIKPLSDPWGGTRELGGRHPHQMTQPEPEADAPEQVVHIMWGMCHASDACLRVYGHPKLLAVAATINGPDFTPFTDTIFVKHAGLGGSVAWHQDGVTHWDAANWDEEIHGFNFQVQLYETTPANCLWVVPGSHREGRIDIKARIARNGGNECLPDAVPLLCKPGDVTIVNRQMLHGSFANTSPHQRISLTFGFHRRASVLGQAGVLSVKTGAVYDAARIFERSAVVQVAIDARARHFADERRFAYQPFVGREDDYRWTPETVRRVITDYNTKDLSI